jgi:hypothetical protein
LETENIITGGKMSQSVSIKIFEDRNVRTLWDEEASQITSSIHTNLSEISTS